MFKGLIRRKGNEREVLVIGIFDGNAQLLREHQPIAFDLCEIFPDYEPDNWCVITYVDPEKERYAVPRGLEVKLLITIHEDALEAMEVEYGRVINMERDEFKVAIFRCRDESQAAEWMRDFIGPSTQVRQSGFAPSDPKLFEGN